MSLQQFLQIFLARRWMVLTAVFASLVGALMVIALVPPRYQASTRIMLDIIKPDPVTGLILANQFVRGYTKTQTELIQDYKVAGRVVDELGWANSPTVVEQMGVPGDPEATRRKLAQTIIDNTEAGLIEGSNILEIKYTAATPDAAKAVADAIRRAYLNVSLSFKRDSASSSADWYQEQAEKARRLLALAENNKSQFERANGLVMQADRTDSDSARLAALSGQGVSPAGVPTSSGVSQAGMELAKVDAQLAQVRQTMGQNHPVVRNLQQQRSALAAQASREQSAAASASSAANAAVGAGRRELEEQKSKVLANREKVAELRQLQDEVDLRRDQYQKAAARVAELRLQGDVSETGLTVLGGAVAPEKPVFPNIPLILAGAFGFGLALGLMAALLTEMLSRRVRSSRDLAAAADNVPVLAVISAAHKSASPGWFAAWWSKLANRAPEAQSA